MSLEKLSGLVENERETTTEKNKKKMKREGEIYAHYCFLHSIFSTINLFFHNFFLFYIQARITNLMFREEKGAQKKISTFFLVEFLCH
jgi:hypothetical protein